MARAARRRRRSPRNRRRASSRGPRRRGSVRLGVVRWLIVALGLVVATNAGVRAHGGDTSYLSLRFLPEKLGALMALACHLPRHLVSDPHPPPGPLLRAAAREAGVPPGVALSMAHAESSLDPHAISGTGAMGLMQMMPATAREQGVDDPFDSAQSAAGGTRYLAQLWRRYRGDARRAVAAYNAGPGRVPRAGRLASLPLETQAYVQRVLAGRLTHGAEL